MLGTIFGSGSGYTYTSPTSAGDTLSVGRTEMNTLEMTSASSILDDALTEASTLSTRSRSSMVSIFDTASSGTGSILDYTV